MDRIPIERPRFYPWRGVAVVGGLLCLLTSCASFHRADTGPVQLSRKDKVWLAFLEVHALGDGSVTLSGKFPVVTRTETDEDNRKNFRAAGTYTLFIERRDADALIASSGDPALINLHEKIKATERAIALAPESARARAAIPADEFLAVMRRYLPPGGKGWCTTEISVDPEHLFYADSGNNFQEMRYGRWSY